MTPAELIATHKVGSHDWEWIEEACDLIERQGDMIASMIRARAWTLTDDDTADGAIGLADFGHGNQVWNGHHRTVAAVIAEAFQPGITAKSPLAFAEDAPLAAVDVEWGVDDQAQWHPPTEDLAEALLESLKNARAARERRDYDDRWCACCGKQDDNPNCCQNLTQEQNEARLIEIGLRRPPAESEESP